MAEQHKSETAPFIGAKLALFMGPDLLVIQRDDKPDIPWPGYWDLPGGGREDGESPVACALRETREEVSVILTPDQIAWSHHEHRPSGLAWYFAAHLPAERVRDVRLGDEGQGWQLMPPLDYCRHPLAVPHFAEVLALYLGQTPASPT